MTQTSRRYGGNARFGNGVSLGFAPACFAGGLLDQRRVAMLWHNALANLSVVPSAMAGECHFIAKIAIGEDQSTVLRAKPAGNMEVDRFSPVDLHIDERSDPHIKRRKGVQTGT